MVIKSIHRQDQDLYDTKIKQRTLMPNKAIIVKSIDIYFLSYPSKEVNSLSHI